MTLSVNGSADTGLVKVITTSGRGLTPTEIADMALRKILTVAETAPPPIRDQAVAFREQLRPVLVYYLAMAARSDRTTLHHQLRAAGQQEAADLILRL